MVSTHSKNISQNGNPPQIGVKIKTNWSHHPVKNTNSPPASCGWFWSYQVWSVFFLFQWNEQDAGSPSLEAVNSYLQVQLENFRWNPVLSKKQKSTPPPQKKCKSWTCLMLLPHTKKKAASLGIQGVCLLTPQNNPGCVFWVVVSTSQIEKYIVVIKLDKSSPNRAALFS